MSTAVTAGLANGLNLDMIRDTNAGTIEEGVIFEGGALEAEICCRISALIALGIGASLASKICLILDIIAAT